MSGNTQVRQKSVMRIAQLRVWGRSEKGEKRLAKPISWLGSGSPGSDGP
jgi:hypothetical protein